MLLFETWLSLILIVTRFYTYGPLAPTAYGNGPSVVEPQADWMVDVMKKMRDQKKTKIDADEQAEDEWKEHTNYVHSFTLRHNLDSWYMGKLCQTHFTS